MQVKQNTGHKPPNFDPQNKKTGELILGLLGRCESLLVKEMEFSNIVANGLVFVML